MWQIFTPDVLPDASLKGFVSPPGIESFTNLLQVKKQKNPKKPKSPKTICSGIGVFVAFHQCSNFTLWIYDYVFKIACEMSVFLLRDYPP